MSGTELARREEAGAPWQPLYATTTFAENVAHVGDPALAAHRRRAWWWWPVALPLMSWISLICFALAVDPPGPGEFVAVAAVMLGVPSLMLALWTRRFRSSSRAIRASRTAPAVEAGPVEHDRERLRAELEVIQRLRDSSSDPDRVQALQREEQALLQRMVRIRPS